MKYIYDLHKVMLKQNLLLVYEGEFSQEITKAVLAMAERNMDSFGEQRKVKTKVFNVMVELLQNIFKHSQSYQEEIYGKNNAIFSLAKTDDYYFVLSGNPLFTNEVGDLEHRLTEINKLDAAGLKEEYKRIIKSKKGVGKEGLSEKGGAGLGFIDMARKSGNQIRFDFEKINDELSFFSLRMTIDRNLESKGKSSDD
ncbi:SiaB family protein kinase [Bernardetia sp.]|uniref:SiaB family protein kinase n=1 Tax=Bernardetia sp. TaxID=1937974 RepID=UPI0025C0E9BB|nr:SiaB family protein kinase [Bernardetia sp.]